MRYLLVACLLLGLTSCSYDYRLTKLNHRELTYQELPDSVKTLIWSSIGDIRYNDLLFVNPSDSSAYMITFLVSLWKLLKEILFLKQG